MVLYVVRGTSFGLLRMFRTVGAHYICSAVPTSKSVPAQTQPCLSALLLLSSRDDNNNDLVYGAWED